MSANRIKKIGVAGAGTMGAGIAQVFAQSGFDVMLFDVSETQLSFAQKSIRKSLETAVAKGKIEKSTADAAFNSIRFSSDAKTLKVDFFIEAIVEQLEIKRDLFNKVAAINADDTILVSNTSSIYVTAIAKGISHPERIAGMHFFNPAHLMKLVEVVSGAETSKETLLTVKALCERIGKTPVLAADAPGFIVNRVARNFYTESLKTAEEQVASIETIDTLMEAAGFKMGPFRLMDTIGNDVNFAVTTSLFNALHGEAKFRPSRLQQQKLMAGHLGKKSGKGFYDYGA